MNLRYLLAAGLLMLCLCGCTVVKVPSEEPDNAIGQGTLEEAQAAFILPADAYTLEEANAPLGQQQIYFAYDEIGRVVRSYYYQQGLEMYVNYTYSDDAVIFTAFCDTYPVDSGYIPINAPFEAAIGMTVHEGHFLTGFAF